MYRDIHEVGKEAHEGEYVKIGNQIEVGKISLPVYLKLKQQP